MTGTELGSIRQIQLSFTLATTAPIDRGSSFPTLCSIITSLPAPTPPEILQNRKSRGSPLRNRSDEISVPSSVPGDVQTVVQDTVPRVVVGDPSVAAGRKVAADFWSQSSSENETMDQASSGIFNFCSTPTTSPTSASHRLTSPESSFSLRLSPDLLPHSSFSLHLSPDSPPPSPSPSSIASNAASCVSITALVTPCPFL